MNDKLILGISAFYHDSAVALIAGNEILYASQEERFSRKKHDESFPHLAIENCINTSNISLSDIDAVVFYEKPLVKFERILSSFFDSAPGSSAVFVKTFDSWGQKFFTKHELKRNLEKFNQGLSSKQLLFSSHHLSHAASAFFPSPFEEAAILTADGVGEWATTTLGLGSGNDLRIVSQVNYPDSLGLLYSAFTQYCGFKVNSGEYKLMGLAPFGTPKFAKLIMEEMIHFYPDGSFTLDMRYFGYLKTLKMVNHRFVKLFGGIPPRNEGEEITQHFADVAASIQEVLNIAMIKIAKYAKENLNTPNLVLAGGVALNCVSNTALKDSGIFENIWIQPAAGDAGGALGAALFVSHQHFSIPRKIKFHSIEDQMKGSSLGPRYTNQDIEKELSELSANFQYIDDEFLFKQIAKLLAEGAAIGWFQGRMEFGPRALGFRSILADPRVEDMQRRLNLKIKFRESFRPFAPSVLEDQAEKWFSSEGSSDYMLLVAPVRDFVPNSEKSLSEKFALLNTRTSKIPAVTHVDGSARIQTVSFENNPRFHQLLSAFFDLTGCPVLINTSFNVRGEPIVCTPKDAYRCFMGTDLDYLIIENIVLDKSRQPIEQIISYGDRMGLD